MVNRYLASGKLLNSKLGLVYIKDKEEIKLRSVKVQILDINKNLLAVCSSIRAAAKKYNISASSISMCYLNKDKLCKNKYYFVS